MKGPTSKKQKTEKQRNRKEKASQHIFTHQLLASTLKVLRNTDWTLNIYQMVHFDVCLCCILNKC